MPWLEFDRGGRRARLDLDEASIVIGRHSDCDIVLETGPVSRRHATIAAQDGEWLLSDLGSRNGTFVNGRRVDSATSLRDGDLIQICDHRLGYGSPPQDLSVTFVDTLGADDGILHTLDAGAMRSRIGGVQPEAALATVLEVTRLLGQRLRLDDLLSRVLDSGLRLLPDAEVGIALLVEEGSGELRTVARRHRTGAVGELKVSRTVVRRALDGRQAILSANAIKDGQFEPSQSLIAMQVQSLMCVPLLGHDDEALGVLEFRTSSAAGRFSAEDLERVLGLASAAAVAVENARMQSQLLAQDRLRRDLENARAVQQSFLPAQPPQIAGYEFFAHYASAQSVGGDYYGFFELPAHRIAIGLGDVSGKGLPAALMMARLSSDVRFSLLQSGDPAEALRSVDRSLSESGLDDRFVTMVLIVLDPIAHRLTIANAGHMPPLLRRADGSVEAYVGGVVGVPLNVTDDPTLAAGNGELHLADGESLLVYSDGLSEATDPGGELFGDPRVSEALRDAPAGPARQGAALIAAATAFAAGAEQRDDTTLLCFGRCAAAPTAG